MARCLVVLNETVGGEELRREVSERIDEGYTFRLLAPAHAAGEEHGVVASGPISSAPSAAKPDEGPGTPTISADQAREWADDILREAWNLLEGNLGASVEGGDVGEPDPFEAVAQALEEHNIDDIIVTTPPQRLARIVGMDLAQRIERRFDKPVTSVTAPPSRPPS